LAFVAPTFAAAQTAIAELSRADLGGCLTGLFRTVLGLDVVPGTTAVTSLAPAANVGDQSAMWQTTIQVTSGGQTVAAYADLTFFRSGRTVATLFDFQLGSPFPAANRNQLLAAMAARAG
jgi:hypothetical protein